jgi:DNA-binding response OmpR family regulator
MSGCILLIDIERHLVDRICLELHKYALAVHTLWDSEASCSLQDYLPVAMIIVSCRGVKEHCPTWAWQLKHDEQTKDIPLVMLSDTDEQQLSATNGARCIADYILPKSMFVPFMLVEILRYWGYIEDSSCFDRILINNPIRNEDHQLVTM